MNNSLSPKTLQIIHHYESLQFGDKQISTPYFNNRRQKMRGGLRVLVGKGTPEEIVEEATIFSLREHIDLENLSADDLKKYLVDHNLGVDCSGFVYHVLNEEIQYRYGKALKSFIKFKNNSLFRRLLIKFRTAENINVKIFADEENSVLIALNDVMPGDIITIIGSNKVGNPDHILLIKSVDKNNLTYIHAFKAPSDGKYNHGIKHGEIKIIDFTKSIQEQDWRDKELFLFLSGAEKIDVRRLIIK